MNLLFQPVIALREEETWGWWWARQKMGEDWMNMDQQELSSREHFNSNNVHTILLMTEDKYKKSSAWGKQSSLFDLVDEKIARKKNCVIYEI